MSGAARIAGAGRSSSRDKASNVVDGVNKFIDIDSTLIRISSKNLSIAQSVEPHELFLILLR